MADQQPFATKDEYAEQWPLKPSLAERCDALLARASRRLRRAFAQAGRDIDAEIAAGWMPEDVPRDVVIDMVRRALRTADGSDDGIPVKSIQQSWGPFQQSVTPLNPNGDLYLSRDNRRELGLPLQRAFSVDLTPAADEGA